MLLPLLLSGLVAEPLKPVVETQPVSADADDPAIWVAPEPSHSLIFGTDKIEKVGGLYAFDLDGKVVQRIENLDRPNNVDVQQDVQFGDDVYDLAVVTERGAKRLRIFKIDRSNGRLSEASGKTAVFTERSDKNAVPMGIGLLKRTDGSLLAIVSPKGGPKKGYLEARPIVRNGSVFDLGEPIAFGDFSGQGEIESVFADDLHQKVYYSDELASLCQVDSGLTTEPVRRFGASDYKGDREGLARYENYLVSSDQIEGGSRLQLFDPETLSRVAVIATVADSTDGLDCTDRPLGPKFPKGLLVMMNSKGKNFLLFDWRDVEQRTRP